MFCVTDGSAFNTLASANAEAEPTGVSESRVSSFSCDSCLPAFLQISSVTYAEPGR